VLSLIHISSLAETKGVPQPPMYLGNREASDLAITTVHSLFPWEFQDRTHNGHSRLVQAYRSASALEYFKLFIKCDPYLSIYNTTYMKKNVCFVL